MERLLAKWSWPGKAISAAAGSNGHFTDRLNPGLTERLQFFAAFLRNPMGVSAVTPSSPSLARAMLHGCDLRRAKLIFELGPGTGAITRFILERIRHQTEFIALELDAQNTQVLRRRYPRVRVHHDSAENLLRYLPDSGRRKADFILSGLPWGGGIPEEVSKRILEAVFKGLKPGGMFTAMGYIHAAWFPAARNFRRQLEAHFREVKISPAVWRNVPPAFVYRCR